MRAKYEKVKNLLIQDAAYLAGIVDGEGTITLTRRNAFRVHRYAAITISSCELSLLKYVLRIVGVGSITNKVTYNPKHSPEYTYRVYGRQAIDVIGIVIPYLRSYKKKRAELIYSKYLKLTPRNGKYTQVMLRRKEKFVNKFFAILPENAKTRRGGSLREDMEMGSIESPVQ